MLSPEIYGDLSVLSNLTSLLIYDATGLPKTYGDISVFGQHPSLSDINPRQATITGDFISLKNNSKLRVLYLEGLQFTGDISVLATCTNAQFIYLGWCSNIAGSVNSLANMTWLRRLQVNNT